jgi:flagellar motor switch protein FliM
MPKQPRLALSIDEIDSLITHHHNMMDNARSIIPVVFHQQKDFLNKRIKKRQRRVKQLADLKERYWS